MFVIAGLGNPTEEYEHTRHNIGFDCADVIAKKLGIEFKKTKFAAMAAQGTYNGEKIMIVKPLTYMNLSGNAIAPIMKYYKEDPAASLVVIYDDSDLPVGKIRIRKKGSAGSHNGMKSIVASLGTEDFARIRVGIGKRPEYMDMVDFVLGRFPKEERTVIDAKLEDVACAVEDMVANGTDHAMNNYN